ncbi:MAG: BTAD domain-containing putative transcriptional regulator [Candidatus Sericytochromatia bacterium]
MIERPCPPGRAVFLVAPGGYGKQHWLRHWSATSPQVIWAGGGEAFSEDYFERLAQDCLRLGLPAPGHGREWAEALPAAPLTVCLPDWEQLEQLERVQQFWQEVLAHQPPQLKILLSARRLPRLPVADGVAGGAACLDSTQLSWALAEAQAVFQDHGLNWEDGDADFWARCQGWPAGMLLWLRRRQEALSEALFQPLLLQALRDWLPPFVTDPAQLWQPELQALLLEWQCDRPRWLPILDHWLDEHARLQPAYWLWRSTQGHPAPLQNRMLLERALSLCAPTQGVLRLGILTRLAHNASLSGDWVRLDAHLASGADYFDTGQLPDQAAWLYLQANRARQCCRYDETHSLIDRLLALSGRHPTVLDFQTRARILRGLTAYQQGQYAQTRQAYQEALYLSELDGSTHTQLELQVMLVFLDRLTGVSEEALPSEIAEQVASLPLGAQPLLWLNLAFCQLLGEQLDLKQGQRILERVRSTSAALGWQSLEPLMADIEARLWRFHKDIERADRLHRMALARLEPQTFDWLYASLNHALTLLRQRQQSAQARLLLEHICRRAHETGTWGLLREAQAALQSLAPEPSSLLAPKPVVLNVADAPLLDIRCFGSFQVRLDGKLIERWPRKRSRHVLIQLLLHPHGMHRESLADWLTGSDDLEQALRSLDVLVHALRKVLEPERKGKEASRYIRFHDACYAFGWDTHYRLDTQVFNQQYQLWLQLREHEPLTAEQAVSVALEIYRGPFLPELDFADDWMAERESYARKATDLVTWSLEYLRAQGQNEEAAERAEQLLRWDPVSEAGYRWLLHIVAGMGDRNRLQRLGERMEQTFEKELACPPPRELLQLYRQHAQQLD